MFDLRVFMHKSKEPLLELATVFLAFASQLVLSIPLALAIFVALMIWFLPDAIGTHQSWAHAVSALSRPEMPHALFSAAKDVFTGSWMVAFFVKLVWPDVERNIVVLQKRYREGHGIAVDTQRGGVE